MKNNKTLSGVFILVVSGVLAKIFSAIYRIVLTRLLGGVGIGIYQLIFPIYSLLVVLTTAGLPMAISKVIAKHKGCEKTVVKKCVVCFSLISIILSLVLVFISKSLARMQGNPEIFLCYIILAPTILFVSISSVLRGYFQGIKSFSPSAISNIIEQFVKLVLGLILTATLIKINLIYAITGAIISIVVSEIVSFLVLLLGYKTSIKKSKNCNLDISFKEIFKDILPITLTNLILPLASFIDSLIVVNLLKINFSTEFSVFLYGLESGAVSTLISLPSIFSFAIATAIMPTLTKNENILNKNNQLNFTIKTILIIVMPCMLCFICFPNQLLNILYGNRLSTNFNGNEIASILLIISSFGMLGMTINQIYSTSLQAMNYRKTTIKNLLIAVLCKEIIQLIFMPIKQFNIYALAIANTVCYLLVFVLNNYKINKIFKINLSIEFLTKLILSTIISVLTMLILFKFYSTLIYSILVFVIGVIIYFICLINLKIFSHKDLTMLKYK